MKIAVSGKGGVGKTTLASLLIKCLALEGKSVIAIDADPDANLAHALAIDTSELIPIAMMKELIEERTGSKPGTIGAFFKMNPTVDDLPEKLSVKKDNINLMLMGGVKAGDNGCVCPESVLLKQLLRHVVLKRDEAVIMDMEAGLEHLGRGTSKGVDFFIIVVEPGKRSIETAISIKRLAADLGVKNLAVVGNKIRNIQDENFIINSLADMNIAGFMPFTEAAIEADMLGHPIFECEPELVNLGKTILNSIELIFKRGSI